MINKRHAAVLLRLAVAFAVVAPLISQDEEQPYFSLSSNETFASGSAPSIQLAGYNVDAVRIRVYRVTDPVQFMRQMEDAHQFGGRYPRPRGKLTLLERIHEWKRSLRREIRYNLRQQFTESPRAHLERSEPTEAKNRGGKATYFAETPVLNQQRLVLSFLQPVSPSKFRWNSQKVDVPVKDKGVFLVEAVYGNLQAYTVLVVSDLVLLTKTGRDHILYYVANRKTGEPVADAGVTVMSRDDTGITLRTGSDGTADYLLTSTAANDLRTVAAFKGDVALGDIETWSLNRRNLNLTGVVYTDRPIYRPGDTTHFRAILRYAESTGYDLPAGRKFAVQVMDNNGNAIYQKDLTANTQGIIHDEIALAKDAGLGYYYIQVRSGESMANCNFQVQEYKKPEYEVHVTPESRRILQGQSTQVTIDSRYYFGEPVAGAKVKYSIYRSRYWFPLWYEPEEEGEQGEAQGNEPNDYGYNKEATQAQGQLDADGKLIITVPPEVSEDKSDTLYRIEAGVTDQAGREISGTGWVIATYGNFVVNVRPDRWFYEPSSSAGLKIETRDYESNAVSAPVHLELRSYNWHYRSMGDKLAETNVTTGPDGVGHTELKLPASGGDYRLIATAPSAGRTVQSETYLWVSGLSDMWGQGADSQSVVIVPGKRSYQAGETAQIMIAAGQDNTPVLVTVEGWDVRAHSLLRSKGGTAVFNYKVTREDEPGVFVTAQFMHDGILYQNSKRVKIPPENHRLEIQLTTDKTQYQPGKPATYNVEVKTPDGKPVPGADLSLGVVDEAIYAIAKDDTPDLLTAFYGNEYNSVETQNSLTYYFSGEAGTRRMQLAAIRPRTKLAQLKPEQLIKPKIRKYFPDTTFWAADMTTDPNGHAQAKFDFPDSLTTWRATVRGSSPDDRYGSTVLKTIVRKNLIVRLAVPRFFVQGDEVVISALVHNYLQTDKQARIDVRPAGLETLNGALTQEILVPKRGEVKVDWRVKARQLSQARITAEALTNEESDALELELPIHPPGVPIRVPRSGSLSDTSSENFSVSYPSTAVTGSRSLSIRLAPSVAGTIFSALEYLTSYPYGCVEQTMSSFLPDVVVTRAMRDLKLKQPMDQAALGEKVQQGLDRLYNFHHEDGGWGWWASDDSHPFMTAYVVAGLADARAAGITVRDDAINKGAHWIEQYFSRNSKIPADLRAYMAYSLAACGHADRNVLQQIYEGRSNLSSYGLAILGLSFEAVQDRRAAAIASELAKDVRESPDEASWPASRDEMLDFSADVTPETTAFATRLLSHEQPQSPLLAKAALWLVNHRDQGYWWSSTKQTAMVIYGLIDYVKATNELHPNLTANVRVNGQNAATAEFRSDNLIGAPAVTLDESKLQGATDQIQIETKGQGRVYYSISADYYSNEAKAQNEGTIALNILRDYYRLVADKSGDSITYDLQPLSGSVTPGDVIAVRLTVSGSNWRYLLIEDPIPAGAEFVKDDNLYHLKDKPSWWSFWFTERENHDDRIAIFDRYFYRRQTEYFYLLKVVNPGIFQVSPARVQPMYQPEYQATTGAVTLEAK